jgi:hypothetical protein
LGNLSFLAFLDRGAMEVLFAVRKADTDTTDVASETNGSATRKFLVKFK